MPCYAPLQAWRAHIPGKSGKYGLVFKPVHGQASLQVPCGQCIGCRLERSRQWAIRCVHESSLYADNCFLTLTYDDKHLPPDGGLHKDDFQKFMKRLRFKFGKMRFFHCGEYGESTGRPHYHACIFGFDFPDKVLWRDRNGVKLYISEELQKLWTYGFSTIGDVTFESAAYVARYITKKITGELAAEHYTRCDPETGEFFRVAPEYVTMSRRPGIGKAWFDQYRREVYPSDSIVSRGKEMKPPKYYDRMYEVENPSALFEVKQARRDQAKKFKENNTPERLKVRERVTRARLSQLKREVD